MTDQPTAEPQPGDIFVTTIHGDVGWAIGTAERLMERIQRWKQQVDTVWRHAGVYVGDGKIVEARPGGADLADLSRYDGQPILWLHCPDASRRAVATAARSYIGTPYSYADYLEISAHTLHVPAPGLRQLIQSDRHMICSQLATAAADKGGWHVFDDGRWPGFATPVDLARVASAWP
jgi:uncharacterized protein YycO